MLFNYHRIDQDNAGDMLSSPVNYFEFDTPTLELEIGPIQEPLRFDGDVILGGGGLLARTTFERRVRDLCENSPHKLISWGIGHNAYTGAAGRHIRYRGLVKVGKRVKSRLLGWGIMRAPAAVTIDYGSIRDIMDRFAMHGIRDYGCGYDWVPCASCMHPVIDKYRGRTIQHDAIVYDHVGRKRLLIDGLPRMGNASGDIDEIMTFLSSGETIITSTYHGAYWGLLLGRRVIVVPWSTKFMGFKHPVVLCHELVDLPGCLQKARAFPEALEECRAATVAYADRVANLLDIEVRRRPDIGRPGLSGHQQIV
ncbi:MAG: hypothetical protein OEN01_12655 [Candidatus Krumholzibacteria bacterium]|nr:hypothetical protein [Candidatus Krumholzibacteria bacterium]